MTRLELFLRRRQIRADQIAVVVLIAASPAARLAAIGIVAAFS
jgi:hypothetical protein